VVAECCYSPSTSILEELKIVQNSSSSRKPRQDLLPATLLLVAMCEVDERVL
jgi:hypothetical protein